MTDSSSPTDVDSQRLAQTVVGGSGGPSKEELDVGFAVQLLESRLFNDRQLANAVASWSLHGSTSLVEHLAQTGLLDPAQCQDLEARALDHVEHVRAGSDATGDIDAFTDAVVAKLDADGKVARLFGISLSAGTNVEASRRQLSGRYMLIRKLGQGGLGTVWLALDQNMQRYVALKEIATAARNNPNVLERFRREAEVTGRLEHPGIVPVHQLGEDMETGRVFYVMRFLGKQTLQDSINEYHERRESGDDDPMLLRNLLTAFVSMCQALGHAHSRKVIHRDLKPENVAIDSFGQVIVIDWGLAKVLDEAEMGDALRGSLSGWNDSERTMAGQVMGTPLYMAPEQAAGRIDEIDERTDIYGLGAILFAILTGIAPHEHSQSLSSASGTRGLITAIAGGPTPRVQDFNESVAPALASICAKAMAKKRYARYESTTQLANDVQRWMAGEQVSTHTERFSQRCGRWIQHHRRTSQLLGALLTVVLVTSITLAIGSRNERLATARTRFDEMRSEAREIEVQLISGTTDLGQNVRFMSTLPPIQGIVQARQVQQNGETPVQEGESEDVWRGRLETIFEGLLRANSEYLAVSYLHLDDEGSEEIVRVERHSSDASYVRRVPKSRLRIAVDDDLVEEISRLEPGEIRYRFRNQADKVDQRSYRARLIASVPVYDDLSGAAFGVVLIESNFTESVKSILNGLAKRSSEIYITNSTGDMLLTSLPGFGVGIESGSAPVSKHVPEAGGFFETGTQRLLSDDARFVCKRVELDSGDTATTVGIVLQLSEK